MDDFAGFNLRPDNKLWIFYAKSGPYRLRKAYVFAYTWFEGRSGALAALHCSFDQVEGREVENAEETLVEAESVVVFVTRAGFRVIETTERMSGNEARSLYTAAEAFDLAEPGGSESPEEEAAEIEEEKGTVRRAAVSLIERNGKVLCVWNLRYNGWSLPGGMVEEGETALVAQGRELREETGLSTSQATQIFEGEHGLPSDSSRASVVHIFKVETFAAEGSVAPREMEPGCPVRWMTREEFLTQSPFGAFYAKVFSDLYDSKMCMCLIGHHIAIPGMCGREFCPKHGTPHPTCKSHNLDEKGVCATCEQTGLASLLPTPERIAQEMTHLEEKYAINAAVAKMRPPVDSTSRYMPPKFVWRIGGFDTFAEEFYSLEGEYETETEAHAAAVFRLAKLEMTQPTSVSGGQDALGIQDRVFILRPDGTSYRFQGTESDFGRGAHLPALAERGQAQSSRRDHPVDAGIISEAELAPLLAAEYVRACDDMRSRVHDMSQKVFDGQSPSSFLDLMILEIKDLAAKRASKLLASVPSEAK